MAILRPGSAPASVMDQVLPSRRSASSARLSDAVGRLRVLLLRVLKCRQSRRDHFNLFALVSLKAFSVPSLHLSCKDTTVATFHLHVATCRLRQASTPLTPYVRLQGAGGRLWRLLRATQTERCCSRERQVGKSCCICSVCLPQQDSLVMCLGWRPSKHLALLTEPLLQPHQDPWAVSVCCNVLMPRAAKLPRAT